MQEQNDRLVGVREAAHRLNMNPGYLGQLCRAGKSPVTCAKRGDGPRSEWQFSDNALNEYIAALFAGQQEADLSAGEPTREAVG